MKSWFWDDHGIKMSGAEFVSMTVISKFFTKNDLLPKTREELDKD